MVLVPSQSNSQGLGTFQNALGGANETAELSGIKEKGKEKEVEEYVQLLTNIALSLIGVIFFILMVYGGYKWMIARGEAKEVETAKDTIIRGVIGLIIVILAYAISSFVIRGLVTATVGT